MLVPSFTGLNSYFLAILNSHRRYVYNYLIGKYQTSFPPQKQYKGKRFKFIEVYKSIIIQVK